MTVNPHIAKYPFLSSSEEVISTFDFEEVLQDDDVIERASERVYTGVNSGMIIDLGKNPRIFSGDAELEVKSYPVSRIIVSFVDDFRIVNKYSSAEAKTARKRLEDEVRSSNKDWNMEEPPLGYMFKEFGVTFNNITYSDLVEDTYVFEFLEDASNDDVREIAQSVFSISSPEDKLTDKVLNKFSTKEQIEWLYKMSPLDKKNEELYSLPVQSYLTASVDMDNSTWNLTTAGLSSGQTVVNRNELFDLFEQLVYNSVSEDLPYDIETFRTRLPDDIINKLEQTAESVRDKIDDDQFSYEIDRIESGLFPPVIDQMKEEFPFGLKHEEKVTLAAFLIHIGMTDKEILDYLGVVDTPGEDPTQYQVKHIRNGGGSGEPYTPANYATIESWGYEWEKDALEAQVKNPLSYYKIKLQDSDEDESESIDPKDPDEEDTGPTEQQLKEDAKEAFEET